MKKTVLRRLRPGDDVVNIKETHVAIQGAGLVFVVPGTDYKNTEHMSVDRIDVIDVSRAVLACGHYEGKGRQVLQRYARDLHAHYARHAQAILAAGQ